MKTRRPPHRRTAVRAVLLTSLAVGLAPATSACKKSTDTIPAGDSTSSAPSATSAVDISYRPGARKLRQDGKLKYKGTEPDGVSEVSVDLTGLLDVSDAGVGKLKVAYSVTDVRKVEANKEVLESFKEGPPDLPAMVKAATGAQVVDLRGDTDDAATKALPENAAKKQGPAAVLEGFVGALLELPSLPPKPLVENEPLKITERKKRPSMMGVPMDMDIESTFTLARIDATGGKRLAEVKIESAQSGALENKGGMLSIDVLVEGMLVFNVDDGVPTALRIRSTQNINFSGQGQNLSVEIVTDVDSTFTPA